MRTTLCHWKLRWYGVSRNRGRWTKWGSVGRGGELLGVSCCCWWCWRRCCSGGRIWNGRPHSDGSTAFRQYGRRLAGARRPLPGRSRFPRAPWGLVAGRGPEADATGYSLASLTLAVAAGGAWLRDRTGCSACTRTRSACADFPGSSIGAVGLVLHIALVREGVVPPRWEGCIPRWLEEICSSLSARPMDEVGECGPRLFLFGESGRCVRDCDDYRLGVVQAARMVQAAPEVHRGGLMSAVGAVVALR